MIRYVGRMRLYFNRHGAAPLVWCIDPVPSDDGDPAWELAVSGIDCNAPMYSRYVPKETADDDDGRPSAWFEVTGELTVSGGWATIKEARNEPAAT